MKQRPIAVTVISCVYLITGAGGMVSHFSQLQPRHPLQQAALWLALLSLLAVIAGAYMLRASDWARWLAIAWIAFHVAISALNPWPELLVHAALLTVIAYFLIRRDSRRYFRAAAH